MANEEFATGMQPWNDATAVAFNYGYNRWWEQNGLTPTAGKPVESVNSGYSANPTAHYTWRKARSDENKTKSGSSY